MFYYWTLLWLYVLHFQFPHPLPLGPWSLEDGQFFGHYLISHCTSELVHPYNNKLRGYLKNYHKWFWADLTRTDTHRSPGGCTVLRQRGDLESQRDIFCSVRFDEQDTGSVQGSWSAMLLTIFFKIIARIGKLYWFAITAVTAPMKRCNLISY